jgi:hypothetical protein
VGALVVALKTLARISILCLLSLLRSQISPMSKSRAAEFTGKKQKAPAELQIFFFRNRQVIAMFRQILSKQVT